MLVKVRVFMTCSEIFDPLIYTATYYLPGLTSCGVTSTMYDMSVAVSSLLYDSYPYVCFSTSPSRG